MTVNGVLASNAVAKSLSLNKWTAIIPRKIALRVQGLSLAIVNPEQCKIYGISGVYTVLVPKICDVRRRDHDEPHITVRAPNIFPESAAIVRPQ